jgi:hypothetical protein
VTDLKGNPVFSQQADAGALYLKGDLKRGDAGFASLILIQTTGSIVTLPTMEVGKRRRKQKVVSI